MSQVPGADELLDAFVRRSLGDKRNKELIGSGFLHKTGPEDIVRKEFDHFGMVYIIRGRGSYIDKNGKDYPLREGSLFFRFPGEEHSTLIEPDSRWTEGFIALGEKQSEALEAMGFLNRNNPVISIGYEGELVRRLYDFTKYLGSCSQGELMEALVKAVDLIRIFLNFRDDDGESIDDACRYFRENCSERRIVPAFCERKGLGYEKFRKDFKKEVGMSPARYIVRQRVDLACEYLRKTDDPVYEISARLGYSSPYEFSSQFKRYTGQTPGDFRKGR